MQAVRLVLMHRPAHEADLALVSQWVQSPEELFFFMPEAEWPLTAEQLRSCLSGRSCATVLVHGGEPVAFASFQRAEVHGACTLGHLLVAPDVRGVGVGRHLVEIMREQARSRYHAREFRVSCVNANTAALLFFPYFGLEPCAVERVEGRMGEPVALIQFRQPLLPMPRF